MLKIRTTHNVHFFVFLLSIYVYICFFIFIYFFCTGYMLFAMLAAHVISFIGTISPFVYFLCLFFRSSYPV